MTIDEMYATLIENSRNPDSAIYDQFREAIGKHIRDTLRLESPRNPEKILPLNYKERMDYIDSRPSQYHSIIQLKNICDEFDKRMASYRARQ